MPLKKRNINYKLISFNIFYLLIVAITIGLVTYLNSEPNVIYICFSAVLGLLVLAFSVFSSDLFSSISEIIITLLSTSVSLVLLYFFRSFPEFPVWIVGCISIACFANPYIGLFSSFFLILQMEHISSSDYIIYFIHVICLSLICIKYKKLQYLRGVIHLETLVASISLLMYIVGKALRLTNCDEKKITFIILTYFIILSICGTMRLSFKKTNNKKSNTEELSTANGFAYLNDMADDLSRMEKLDTEVKDSLEAILEAEINDLQVTDVEPITDYTVPEGLSPVREADVDYNQFISDHEYVLKTLKKDNKQGYTHCKRVAALAEEVAKIINANSQLTKAIGLFYKTEIAEDYPEKLSIGISQVNRALISPNKKDSEEVEDDVITTKEAALILITHEISTVFFFMKASKSSSLNIEKIVDKAFSNELMKGKLNNSGLSLKECSEIRQYFVTKLSSLV